MYLFIHYNNFVHIIIYILYIYKNILFIHYNNKYCRLIHYISILQFIYSTMHKELKVTSSSSKNVFLIPFCLLIVYISVSITVFEKHDLVFCDVAILRSGSKANLFF